MSESELLVIVPIHSPTSAAVVNGTAMGKNNNATQVPELQFATQNSGSNDLKLNIFTQPSTSDVTEKKDESEVVPYQILTCPERFVSNIRSYSHLWFTHLFLLSILLAYTALGALVFTQVEESHERQEKTDIVNLRRTMQIDLWNVSQEVDNSTEWLNKTSPMLCAFEKHLERWYVMGFSTDPHKKRWSFWGAMFFCGTVYSTIVFVMAGTKSQLAEEEPDIYVRSRDTAPSLLTLPVELVSDAVQSFQETVRLSGVSLSVVKSACIHYATLLMATYVYCFMGGFLFRVVEGWHELRAKCDIQRERRSIIEDFWNQSAFMDYEEWKGFATDKLRAFEGAVHRAHEDDVTTYSGTKVWSFDGALVYSITVFTTIGYGHIVPSTTPGRALTMVYATFGIPLLLMVLADFGKLFTRGIKFLGSLAHRFYHTKSCQGLRRTAPFQAVVRKFTHHGGGEDEQTSTENINSPSGEMSNFRDDRMMSEEESVYEIDDEFDLPVLVAVGLLLGYIMLGALMFIQWEDGWSYFEAVYFVFISMSTIGFGDYVPQHPIFMMGTFVYLLFGLALTSMCINVIQEWLTQTFKKASNKLGNRMGITDSKIRTGTVTNQLRDVNSSLAELHSSLIKSKGD